MMSVRVGICDFIESKTENVELEVNASLTIFLSLKFLNVTIKNLLLYQFIKNIYNVVFIHVIKSTTFT